MDRLNGIEEGDLSVYLVNGARTKEDMVQIQARLLSTGENQHIWRNWETSPIPPPKK